MTQESQEISTENKKTLKGKLLRAFAIASAGLVGAAGTHSFINPQIKEYFEERSERQAKEIIERARRQAKELLQSDINKAIKTSLLSQGEAALARMVFGPTFNTKVIGKSYVSRGNTGEVCPASDTKEHVVLGCVIDRQPHIFMSEPQIFIDDFSRDGDLTGGRSFVFFHEMTHVWQGMTNESEEGCDIDSEDDATPKSFDDSCHEEQGNLVGRYVTIYLMPNAVRYHLQQGIQQDPQSAAQYHGTLQKLDRARDIIEARFPHARPHRQRQEANVTTLTTCWNNAGTDEAKSRACNMRYRVNPAGEPLTTSAREVTFTLPDGRVTHPAIKLDPALLARR